MKTRVALTALALVSALASAPAVAGVESPYTVFAAADPGLGAAMTTPQDMANSIETFGRFASGYQNLMVNGFETFQSGLSNLVIPFDGENGRVNATLSGGNGKVQVNQPPETEDFAGRFSVSPDGPTGSKFWEVDATEEGSTFELNFNRKVQAFGFFGVDIGDFNGTLLLEFLDDDGGVLFTIDAEQALQQALPGDGSVLYLGVDVDDSNLFFDGIRFRTAASTLVNQRFNALNADDPGNTRTDTFGFDSFTVVAAPGTQPPNGVPAPGTALLLGSALAGLALMRRRA